MALESPDILLAEWKEVRESLRYFGNKRFAQLTVFIAANGFLLNAFFSQGGTGRRIMLAVIGAILSVLFLVMESSSKTYWDEFAKRGKLIEGGLSPLELMTKYRPAEKLFSATNATFAVYIAMLVLWVLACFLDKPVPNDVPRLVQQALDAAPGVTGNQQSNWQLVTLYWNPATSLYELRLRNDDTAETIFVAVEPRAGQITRIQRPAP